MSARNEKENEKQEAELLKVSEALDEEEEEKCPVEPRP